MGLAKGVFTVETSAGVGKDPTELLYYMDRYDVNMCVLGSLVPAKVKDTVDVVNKYPDKFVALCYDEQTQIRNSNGEEKWSMTAAAKELDEFLSTGFYSGIGVGIPRDRTFRRALLDWEERLDQVCEIFELARKYKFPVSWHTGIPHGAAAQRDMARSRAHMDSSENGNPLLAHELAAMYPDVPIIFNHGGIEGSGYFMEDYERCLNVAASHHNVYLETGTWWAELYEKPLKDPNIGAKKLVWGCAPGQPHGQAWMPGCVPETFTQMLIEQEPTRHRTDIWGWSMTQLGRLNIPQDDMNLIMGGNAAFLYKLKTPLPYDRMFKKVQRRHVKD